MRRWLRWMPAAAPSCGGAGCRHDGGLQHYLRPLAIRDKIVTGVAGGEYGIRGFIDAYDPRTGKRLWRTYTIPGPGARQ